MSIPPVTTSCPCAEVHVARDVERVTAVRCGNGRWFAGVKDTIPVGVEEDRAPGKISILRYPWSPCPERIERRLACAPQSCGLVGLIKPKVEVGRRRQGKLAKDRTMHSSSYLPRRKLAGVDLARSIRAGQRHIDGNAQGGIEGDFQVRHSLHSTDRARGERECHMVHRKCYMLSVKAGIHVARVQPGCVAPEARACGHGNAIANLKVHIDPVEHRNLAEVYRWRGHSDEGDGRYGAGEEVLILADHYLEQEAWVAQHRERQVAAAQIREESCCRRPDFLREIIRMCTGDAETRRAQLRRKTAQRDGSCPACVRVQVVDVLDNLAEVGQTLVGQARQRDVATSRRTGNVGEYRNGCQEHFGQVLHWPGDFLHVLDDRLHRPPTKASRLKFTLSKLRDR